MENGVRPVARGKRTAAVSKADERRLDIVNRSALLFDSKGADQVSMSDIAEEVGLAKPSLYHYFASKDEILNSIHVNTIEFLLDGTRRRRATDASPDVVLRGALGDIFSLMETHPGHIRVFFESARRLPQDLLDPVRKRRATSALWTPGPPPSPSSAWRTGRLTGIARAGRSGPRSSPRSSSTCSSTG
jgi:AcrR family transcriptional regulator